MPDIPNTPTPNLDPLQRDASQLVGTFDTLGKKLDLMNDQLAQLNKVGSESMAKLAKGEKDAKKNADKLQESLMGTKDLLAKLPEATKNFEKAAEKDVEGVVKKFEELDRAGRITTKSSKRIEKSLHGVAVKFKAAMNLKDEKKKAAALEAVSKEARGLGVDLVRTSKVRGFGEIFKNFKSRAEGIKDVGRDTQKFAGGIKDAGSKLASMGGIAGKAGGALLKSVGGALGGISGMLTKGPWAAIAVGVQELWKLGMAADTFKKNANKAFAQVRGPDIMTKDVAKQFKDFNNKLFNTARNLEVGLNAKEVREFVMSVTQAGVSIGRLSDGFHNYRDAVYIAAKASKTMGLDLPYVGKIMGDMINEFRLDMDKTDTMFTQIAFDAQKAGVSSDMFWNAIENASASLVMYGDFLKGAGDSMTAFSKTGVMGAKDTAGAVADLGQSFNKMSEENRAAFIGLTGTKGIKEMFKGVADRLQAQSGEFAAKITYMEEKRKKAPQRSDEEKQLVDQITQLRNQQGKANAQMIMAQRGMAGGMVDMAPALPMLSDQVFELTDKFFSNRGMGGWIKIGKTLGTNQIKAEKMLEAVGMDPKLVAQMAEMAVVMSETLDSQVGYSEEGNVTANSALEVLQKNAKLLENPKNVAAIDAGFGRLDKAIGESSKDLDTVGIIEAENSMVAELKGILSVDEESAKALVKTYKLGGPLYKKQLRQVMKGENTPKDIAKLSKLAVKAGINQKYVNKLQSVQKNTTNDMMKNADATFKESVKQTLSFKDMQDIAMDEGKWRLSNMRLLTGINEGVFGIFKGLMKKWGEKEPRTAESRLAAEALKKAGYRDEDIKKMLGDKSGVAIADEIKKQRAVIEKESTNIAAMKIAQDAGVKAQIDLAKSGDPTVRIAEEISDLTRQMGVDKVAGKDITAQQKSIDKLTNLQKVLEKKRVVVNKKLTKESLKDMQASLTAELAALDTQTTASEKTLKEATDIVNNIAALNTTNKDILKYTMLASEGGQEEVAANIEDLIKQGYSLQDIVNKTGMKPVEIAMSLKKTGRMEELSKLQAGWGGGTITALKANVEAARYLEKKQGMQKPEKVTSPGAVVLHVGEMIVPKMATDFQSKPVMPSVPKMATDFQSKPVMPSVREGGVSGRPPLMPVTATRGGGGGGTGAKSYNFTINADQKDLAKRIAEIAVNAVRKVDYDNKVNGMG